MAPESNGAGQTLEDVRAMSEIPLSDLMAYCNAVRAVTRRYLDQATYADLAREYHHPRMGALTGAWIVGHILVEESQHTAQAALIWGIMRGAGA
jgi:hypothetical protein